MGLRIKTNVSSLKAQRALDTNAKKLGKSMERLASGFRINEAADDAAGLAISESLKAKTRSMQQARRNSNDGISMIQVAEGGMNEVGNILIRLRELATQSASDTIGSLERSFTNREYVQLVDEIDRIVNSTEFNGLKILQGSENNNGVDELVVHVGAGDASVANTDTIIVNIDDIKMNATEVLGLGRESEIGPTDPTESFSREGAAEKLSVIDTAIQRLAGSRAGLGAIQNRLGSVVNNLGVAIENAASSNSRIRDVDFAEETAEFTQQQILNQGGISVLSQANSQPEMVLSLLR